MGFFSFKTQDTDRSISNIHSSRDSFFVAMHDNAGNIWTERFYDGYGVFGGKDYYELLAEMNGLTTREEGIHLAYSGKDYLSPNLTERLDWEWVSEAPESCRDQGFFYDEEEI
jgi:hypothetical protein